MKKITDRMRRDYALDIIEDISTYAQSTDPKRDWKKSQDAVCQIYRIAHTILIPKCRKNHPRWTGELDAAVRARLRREGR